MLLVKTTANGQVEQFPYTLGDLRRDNPQTSFPKKISDAMLASYGIFGVTPDTQPDYDPLVQAVMHDLVPRFDGRVWRVGYAVTNRPLDQAEQAVRNQRDRLLADSDWIVIMHTEKGTNIPAAWEIYRQSLRDITSQPGFPHNVTWPTKP